MNTSTGNRLVRVEIARSTPADLVLPDCSLVSGEREFANVVVAVMGEFSKDDCELPYRVNNAHVPAVRRARAYRSAFRSAFVPTTLAVLAFAVVNSGFGWVPGWPKWALFLALPVVAGLWFLPRRWLFPKWMPTAKADRIIVDAMPEQTAQQWAALNPGRVEVLRTV